MCAKMGRPTDNPKDKKIQIRATEDDVRLLNNCCELLNKTQYEIIMQGVRMVYETIKK
jgi:hypothetical protein